MITDSTLVLYSNYWVCMGKGLQAHVYKYTSNPTPSLHLFLSMVLFCRLHYEITGSSTGGDKMRCRDGVTCADLVCHVLPALDCIG